MPKILCLLILISTAAACSQGNRVGIVTPPERTVNYDPSTVDGGLAAAVGFQVVSPLGDKSWRKYGTGNSQWQPEATPASLTAGLFKTFCLQGADASGGATHITATGVKIGDKVVMVADITDHNSQAGAFEVTVTVADQIQQATTNLSAKTLVIIVIAQS